MKTLIINGSPKANGNTACAGNLIKETLEKKGITTDIYHLAGKDIRPCLGCMSCFKTRDNKCIIDDDLNELIALSLDYDGIILGSPIHFATISSLAKCAFDRMFFVGMANDNSYRHKIGASYICVRRSGGVTGFDALNNYLLFSEMFVPSGNYWNVIHGRLPNEVDFDDEGKQTLEVLANNFAFLLKAVKDKKEDLPSFAKKKLTNFIREDLK